MGGNDSITQYSRKVILRVPTLLAILLIAAALIPAVSATPPDPGHPAGEISGGTFSSNDGSFTFPSNLNVTADAGTLHVDGTNNRVGIGTTTPDQALKVTGNANITDNVYADAVYGVPAGPNNAGSGRIIFPVVGSHYPAGDTIIQSGSTSGFYGYAAGSRIMLTGANYTTGADIILVTGQAVSDVGHTVKFNDYSNNTKMMVNTSNGRVGIGTTNPRSNLQVSGTNPVVLVSGALNDNPSLCIAEDSTCTTGGINISYEGFSDVAQIGVAPFYNSVINIPRGSGYVGINKASPQYELDVNGKIGAQHYVYLNASAGGDGFYMLGPLGSYAAQLWASGSNGGYLGLSNGTTFTTVLSPYSDTSYFLDQNVGIGTNSPSYPLHVVGDVKIGNVAGDNKKLYFGDASYVYVGEGPSDDNLYLYGNNRVAFATASTDRLIIDSSGNIAIGTSSITVPTVLKVKNTNNNNAQIEVMNANNNNAIMMANWNNGNAVFGTTNNTDVAFRTDNTDRMTIKTSTGRVGIGTSGPAQLLEVEGANPRILVDSTSGNSELNLAVPTYGTWAMYHNSGDGSLRFYKSGDRFWVTSGGELYSSALANAAGTYYMMYNTGSGRITYTSSSARYKKNIRDIEVATSDVFDLKPRSFEYNNNTGSENVTDFGLIAEEVADVLPEMVLYDDEGRPSNVKYDRLAILLLVELNKTRSELDATRQELCTYNAEYSWCQTD